MKNKNNLLLVLPLIVFVGTFFIVKTFDNRSYAQGDTSDALEYTKLESGTLFDIVKKNTFSWHTVGNGSLNVISGNSSTSNPFLVQLPGVGAGTSVGTWYMRSNSAKDVNGNYYTAVAYKATLESNLDQTHSRKRYTLTGNNHTSLLSPTQQATYIKVMPYMYPFINLGATSSDSNTLKAALKDGTLGIGSKYNQYDFDKLNVNEAVAATQAAIWAINTGSVKYQYTSTLTSLSDFSTCSNYYDGKILTSEEKKWYEESQCSENGNFYKYVFNHTKDSNTENRINTLINWYVSELSGKVNQANTGTEKFELDNANTHFTSEGLTAHFTVENMPSYTIKFTSESGETLLETQNDSDNTYTIDAAKLTDVNTVNVEVISTTATPHLIYYYSCSGRTDFIGIENSYYSEKLNLNIRREEEQLGKIMLYKIGNSSKNVVVENSQTGTFDSAKCEGNCLSGAKFQLYYKNKKNEIKEIQTDYSDGSMFFDNLPLGDYYLLETQPAPGYSMYNFTDQVDSEGYIKITLTAENATNGVDVIVNNPYANDVCFAKVVSGDNSQKLSGAIFIITDISGNIIQDADLNGQSLGVFTTSDDEKTVCFDGKKHKRLEIGSYFLQEVSAPEGYTVSPTRYLFTVGSGFNASLTEDVGVYTPAPAKDSNGVINIPNVKGLTLTKTNEFDGTCVEGATLTLKDQKGNNLVDWKSTCTKDGDMVGYNIPICLTDAEKNALGKFCATPGKYTLSETVTPKGYATANDVEITIESNGKIDGNPNMLNAPIEVCIYNVKKGTDEILTGSKFEVYRCTSKDDCSSEIFLSFIASEEPCFSAYFDPDEYIVKQTKEPEGYLLNEDDKEITVENRTGKQIFYIENETIAPKTSIDYSITVIIIASIFMMFGIGLVGYYEYKKQH